jgi:hypothetical protein
VRNPCISRVSYEFFIAAALLVLFGASAMHNQGPHGPLQIALAVMMSGGGMYVRSGTREGRVIGLYAAAATVVVGGYVLVFENDYFVGTIIAIFALFRLWSAGGRPVMQQVAQAIPSQPLAPFDAPEPYGGGDVAPQLRVAPEHAPFYPAEQAPFYAAPERRPEDPA